MRTLIISILAVGTSVALAWPTELAPPVQAKRLPPEKSTQGNIVAMTPTLIATISEDSSPRSKILNPLKAGAGPVNPTPGSLNRFRCAGRIQAKDRCAANEDRAGRGSDQREVDGGA